MLSSTTNYTESNLPVSVVAVLVVVLFAWARKRNHSGSSVLFLVIILN